MATFRVNSKPNLLRAVAQLGLLISHRHLFLERKPSFVLAVVFYDVGLRPGSCAPVSNHGSAVRILHLLKLHPHLILCSVEDYFLSDSMTWDAYVHVHVLSYCTKQRADHSYEP